MNPTSKPIADSKLVTFVVGQQKKSRFQKAREEKELKQKLDDEETAKVYDSFVSSFTEEEDGKTFVRGGLAGHRDNADSVYGGNKGEVYKLESKAKGSEMDKLMSEMKERDSARLAGGDSTARTSGKGKRQIDDFLNEIINRQETQGNDRGRGDSDSIYGRDREPSGGNVMSTSLNGGYIEKGSFDNGDPTTTNLYLGSLSPATTEEDLLDLFGRYGDINSVKIMWPRSEEEKARKRNCGFVSFKRRSDAEDALIELQDYDLDGYKMVLGWGKAVKISNTPFTLTRSAQSAPVTTATAAATAHIPLAVPPVPLQFQQGPPPSLQSAPLGMYPPPPPMHIYPAHGMAPLPPQHVPQQYPPQQYPHPQFPPQYPPGAGMHMVQPPQPHPHPNSGAAPPMAPTMSPPMAHAQGMRPPQPGQPFPSVPPPHPAGMHPNVHPGANPSAGGGPPPLPLPASVPATVSGFAAPPPAFQQPPSNGNISSAMLPPRPSFPPPGTPVGATAVAPLPHPAAGSAPLSAIDPVPAHRPSAPAEDINTMSVDSFLDSIIASTTKPAAISVVPESTPSTHDDQQQAPQAPQVPQFRPPPVATPVLLPSAPLTGTLSGVAPELKAHIIVTEPEDATQRALIDLVAKYVATDGEAFEKNVKAKEEGNMMYSFLFESDTPEAHYYRWRTYANVWGETGKRWSDTPVQWSVDGQVLAPPPCPHQQQQPDESHSGDGNRGSRAEHASRKRSRSRSRSTDRHSGRKHRRSHSRSPSHSPNNTNRPRSGSFSSAAAPHNTAQHGDSERHHRRRSRSRSRSWSRGREVQMRDGNRDRDRDSRDVNGDRHGGRQRDSSRDRDGDKNRSARDGGTRGRDHRSHRDRERERQEAERADRSRYAGMTGAQIEREKAKKRLEQLAKLSREDYEEWKVKLRELNLSRESIKQAMGFAYDKIESAEEIVSMLKDRLILPSSYAAVKIAGLYLLSDILHNAGAPIKHASTYRGQVQAALPEVIENIAQLLHHTSGRMSAFNIEDRVKKIFAVWAEWSVFPALYLIGLQAMFTFSEADHSAMRAYVSAQLEEEQLDGISLVSEGTNSGTSELDALRKKAKLCGVAFTDATGKYELQFKIEYVDKFAQTRYGSSAVASISTLLLPTAPTVYSDSDDIDGVPLDSGEMSSTGGDEGSGGGAHRQSLTQLEKLLHSEHSTAVDSEYDDDIDGVPLTIGEYSIPVSSQPPPNL